MLTVEERKLDGAENDSNQSETSVNDGWWKGAFSDHSSNTAVHLRSARLRQGVTN